jgi:hypothetical protein
MGYINQVLGNKSFPSESAFDMIGGAGWTGFRTGKARPVGSYKPTCPWTPTGPGSSTGTGDPTGLRGATGTSVVLVATNDANQTAETIALEEGVQTTVLTAAISVGKVTNTYKIDSNVNVLTTIKATTPPSNVTFTIVCSLYSGTNLLATHTEVRTVYAATDTEIPWSDGIIMTWIDTPAAAGTTTYTIQMKVTAVSGTVKAEASTRSINIIQL